MNRIGKVVEPGVGYVFYREPLVCADVTRVVDWVEAYLREREEETNGGGVWKAKPFTSQFFIEAGVSSRQWRRMKAGEHRWVGYEIADRLLVEGMGRPDLMGLLTFVPNPSWSQERWLEWKAGCETD